MKSSARLSSAVFQLTPTRTRCDLIIIAKDKKEKIASGLLNPFLAHLKTAQDQIVEGGYSIFLEPESGSDTSWFTKATLERFVRFVSTPEILERVCTIESEILQIEEAIAMQSCNDIAQSIVENHRRESLGRYEGDKSMPNANEEKAIVLYTPGAPLPESSGSCSQEGNSKVQLLKVLETRRIVLQKEQQMAFARAVAAGFSIDDMVPLVSFAECFGAMRLKEACSRFMDLWKSKHETGQWIDVDPSEPLVTRSDFSAMDTSGIVLSTSSNDYDESNCKRATENNGKSGSKNDVDNPVPNVQQEYIQGQFPQFLFPPWPGAQPVFQSYPVQGMPYYQAYTGNGPFFQPHHHSMEHVPWNFGPQSGQKNQSLDVMDGNTGSETREINRRRSSDDRSCDAEGSHSQKPRTTAGCSNKKQSGMVVIRNINYITSKEKKSGADTNLDSHSDTDTENEYFEDYDHDVIRPNNKRSSKSGESYLKSVDKLNFNNDEVAIFGKDGGDRQWQAFQDCLLRGSDEDAHADNKGMFAMGKDGKTKRHVASDDPLALGARDPVEIQEMRDIQRISGNICSRLKGSDDKLLFSSADNDFRGSNDLKDIHLAETNGRKILFGTAQEDFMIGSQHNQANLRNSSDPIDLNNLEGATKERDKIDTVVSHGMDDETLIVQFSSMSVDQVRGTDRTAVDMISEIPLKYQKLESGGHKNKVNYEPNDLSLMPERTNDKRSIRYDLALDYEMQVCAKASEEKEKKATGNVKGGVLKKSDKDKRSKNASDSLQKQRTGGPMRKGKSSSTLEDARARAERLRSYKADLQKMKKEKEEEEVKRLESLKLARQKRIAARGSSTSAKPSTESPQTKQLLPKLSRATNRGFKFSDSEPGSSSPLQRSKTRASLGSSEPPKASKTSRLSEGSHMEGNRLIRSSSLSVTKRGNNVPRDSKASISRIRRLSEPKTVTKPPVTMMKSRSAEAVLKRKLSEGPDRNKVSAIIDLDRSKAASLPELKLKTPKSHVNVGENGSGVKDKQKVNGTRPSTFPIHAELNVNNCDSAHQIDADDNPIVEKNVLVLECEKPSLLHPSEVKPEARDQQHNHDEKVEKCNVTSESGPTCAASLSMDKGPITRQLEKQSDHNKARTAYSEKDPPNNASLTTDEKPYQVPHACVSSLEKPSPQKSEYGEGPPLSSELPSGDEDARTHVPDIKALKMDKYQVISEKTSSKDSSKGLRRLLKFGKKNQKSSSVDQSVESGSDVIEHGNDAKKMASTSEVHTLKNLISRNETSTDGHTPQKTSRHFSLFSPFRSKTSEKKQAS